MRFPNVYGIDIPTSTELVAHNRSDAEITEVIVLDVVFVSAAAVFYYFCFSISVVTVAAIVFESVATVFILILLM